MMNLPRLQSKREYEEWKAVFLYFVDENVVGPYIRLSLTEGENQSQIPPEASPVEKEQRESANNYARNYMTHSMSCEFISDIFSEIIGQINSNKMTGKELWDCNEWLVLGTKGLLTGRELEAENSELKGKISILEAKTQQIVSVESSEEKISELKDANADLQKRLSDWSNCLLNTNLILRLKRNLSQRSSQNSRENVLMRRKKSS
ncbi:hypothetical protein L6452_07182 [Arctium lappa]|uniref:Uncharacterized protein n=1 Tax=Arctium lappa TaxID=4217 RepID=A0ACB9EK75_ARCLA|nr:hypothetical protein L6452_07182 [Arctium lappa]